MTSLQFASEQRVNTILGIDITTRSMERRLATSDRAAYAADQATLASLVETLEEQHRAILFGGGDLKSAWWGEGERGGGRRCCSGQPRSPVDGLGARVA